MADSWNAFFSRTAVLIVLFCCCIFFRVNLFRMVLRLLYFCIYQQLAFSVHNFIRPHKEKTGDRPKPTRHNGPNPNFYLLNFKMRKTLTVRLLSQILVSNIMPFDSTGILEPFCSGTIWSDRTPPNTSTLLFWPLTSPILLYCSVHFAPVMQ